MRSIPHRVTTVPKALPFSETEWEKKYRKTYGKAPTGMELQQFMRNRVKPSRGGEDEAGTEPTNDES